MGATVAQPVTYANIAMQSPPGLDIAVGGSADDADALGGKAGGVTTGAGLDRIFAGGSDTVRRHPILVGILATGFLFAKAIRVSRAHPDTALTLITSADASTITLGGVLSLLYTVTLIGSVASLCVVGRGHDEVSGHLIANMGVLTVSLAAGFLLLPLPILASVGVLAVCWRGLDALTRGRYLTTEGGLRSRAWRLAVVVLAAGCLVMALWAVIDEAPWVAPERLDTNTGSIVGYVVSSGDWVTVLTEDDRTIRRVRDTDIKARGLCDLVGRSSLRTLPQILFADEGAGRYPRCR